MSVRSTARVESVHLSAQHGFSKVTVTQIRLLADLGVEGDAHLGVTVQHRSRVAQDPTRPNLRQVHLIHGELLDDLRSSGLAVVGGQLGENVTTRDIDLLDLPMGTRLRLGVSATIEITGLRNPCHQLNAFHDGLQSALLDRDADGGLIRKGASWPS